MEIMKAVSQLAVPFVFLLILFWGFASNIKVYDCFVEGAKDGICTIVKILPSLVGLLVAVSVFRASGALDFLISFIKPVGNLIGIPADALPLALLRPISGSASLALVADILHNVGPDSFTGRVVSTMMGSTETIFYTLTVYFGYAGIKNIRYTLMAALTADLASVLASVWICSFIFGRG